MKFKIKVTYRDDETGEDAWWEEYEKDEVEDAQQWAENTIENFNNTLWNHEKPRKLLDVVILNRDTKKDHEWVKTNLTTLTYGDRMYDKVECQACGITGKRWGLNKPKRDSRYRAKVYKRCDTAQEHLAKHGHPKG